MKKICSPKNLTLYVWALLLTTMHYSKQTISLDSGRQSIGPVLQNSYSPMSLNLARPQNINQFTPNTIQNLSALLSQMTSQPNLNNYGMVYPQMNTYPQLQMPFQAPPSARTLVNFEESKKIKKDEKEPTPEKTKEDRELLLVIAGERQKIEDFMVQFLLVTKRHTFINYFRFRKFYENYLNNAEEKLLINHQEYLYLYNLERYVFVKNYKNKSLHYTIIRSHMHIILQQETRSILTCLHDNKPFNPRDDYFKVIRRRSPNAHKRRMDKVSLNHFRSSYTKLKHAMHLEQEWHNSLRTSKKHRYSHIRVRELKRNIHKGQAKIKRLLKEIRKFNHLSKTKKIADKEVTDRLKVVRYLLQMIYEHKMGIFFNDLSTYYHHLGLENSTSKISKHHMQLLEEKVYSLRQSGSPLSFLISVFRILKMNHNALLEQTPKVKSIESLSRIMTQTIADPRERIIIKVFFDIFISRINEIDFFLFDSPDQYFTLDPKKLTNTILFFPFTKDFIQFNANIDLLFVQIAKIEVHLHSGKDLSILPKVRAKYFQFFVLLIQPMIDSKKGFKLNKIQRDDKKFFSDVKSVKAFKKLIDLHLEHSSNTHRIVDLELSELSTNQKNNNPFEQDVHDFLESDNGLEDMDEESSLSNDFFFDGKKNPMTRHKGSEISSELDDSEINEADKREEEVFNSSNEVIESESGLSNSKSAKSSENNISGLIEDKDDDQLKHDSPFKTIKRNHSKHEEEEESDVKHKNNTSEIASSSEVTEGGSFMPSNRRKSSDDTDFNTNSNKSEDHLDNKSGHTKSDHKTNNEDSEFNPSGPDMPNFDHHNQKSNSSNEDSQKTSSSHHHKNDSKNNSHASHNDSNGDHKHHSHKNHSDENHSHENSSKSELRKDHENKSDLNKSHSKHHHKDHEKSEMDRSDQSGFKPSNRRKSSDDSDMASHSEVSNSSNSKSIDHLKNKSKLNKSENNSNDKLKNRNHSENSSNSDPLKHKKNSDNKHKKQDKDDDSEEHEIGLHQFETSDGKSTSVEELDLNLDGNFDQNDELEVKRKTNPKATIKHPMQQAYNDIPVKVKHSTIRSKIWEDGGFEKKKSKFTRKSFEEEESDVEHMIVSIGDLKKVKINRLLVLRAKIISEIFTKFFSGEDSDTTMDLVNEGLLLKRNGIIKQSTSRKLNYLLMVIVEGRKLRQAISTNEYFTQIIDLWKVFLIEYSSTCQLKLMIQLLKKVNIVHKKKLKFVWKNLIRFLEKHRQYNFVTCPKEIISTWIDKSIFAKTTKTETLMKDSFKKVLIKYNHRKKADAIRHKKALLKQILKKIRTRTTIDPILQNIHKTMLLRATPPGNKLTGKDPQNLTTEMTRKSLTSDYRTSSTEPINNSKVKLLADGEETVVQEGQSNYSSEFQTLFNKKTVMDMLMGHLKKLKMKSSNKTVGKELLTFTKSLVVGALIDSKKGQPTLANLAKLSFKLKPKDMQFIKKLHLEYRNVDNIRVSDKYNNIFTSLKKIFFKPRSPPGDDDGPPGIKRRFRKRLEKNRFERRRFKKKGKAGCLTRVFKKCNCTGSGPSGGTGCCGDDGKGDGQGNAVSDDSVYNYRPNYDFNFEFENEEEMGQFEEFLRSTESIDKLLSSNMIDLDKAKEEFEKAEVSKTFTVNVNGKNMRPEDILIPKDNNDSEGNTSNKTQPDDSSHEDSSEKSEPRMIVNPNFKGVEHDIDDPFNEKVWRSDIKKIDLDIRNQPSLEDAIDREEIPIDEFGNPIEKPIENIDQLEKKIKEVSDQDDTINEFIKRNKPILDEDTDESNRSDNEDSNAEQDVSQQSDLDELVNEDLLDKETSSEEKDESGNSDQDELDNVNVDSRGMPFIDPLETPEDLSHREDDIFKGKKDFDSEEDSNKSEEDGLDDSSNETKGTPVDQYYADKFVKNVEQDLKNKLPMKKYKFGAKDWDHEQVYTDDIKDEGILGADIDKYPSMSDAMKLRLNKEILDNGGYPKNLGEQQKREQKMVYIPFDMEDGKINYHPNAHHGFLI